MFQIAKTLTFLEATNSCTILIFGNLFTVSRVVLISLEV